MPHIHEKIDYTVEIFIVHKNKVLLRMHDKFKIWLSVGGHIELDEDPVQAAVREVKEEVGLDIDIVDKSEDMLNSPPQDSEYKYLITPRYLGKHFVSGKHQHIVFVYFAKSASDAISDSHSEHERADTRWVSAEELETMDLVTNVKFYAQEALKELGEKQHG